MGAARIGSVEAVEHDVGHAAAARAMPQLQLAIATHGVPHCGIDARQRGVLDPEDAQDLGLRHLQRAF